MHIVCHFFFYWISHVPSAWCVDLIISHCHTLQPFQIPYLVPCTISQIQCLYFYHLLLLSRQCACAKACWKTNKTAQLIAADPLWIHQARGGPWQPEIKPLWITPCICKTPHQHKHRIIIGEAVQINTSASFAAIRAHYWATIYIIKPGINNSLKGR